jgi:hypothetical protein
VPQGGLTLSEDAARREVNRDYNERKQARRQRRRFQSAGQVIIKARGEESPSESESLGDDEEEEEEDEDEEEGERTSLHSPPPEDLPSLGNLFSRQAGMSVGVYWLKHPQTGDGALSGPQPYQASHWHLLTYRG